MRCADHLREVNDNRFACFASDEDVEFIIIPMDEARVREAYDDVHQI